VGDQPGAFLTRHDLILQDGQLLDPRLVAAIHSMKAPFRLVDVLPDQSALPLLSPTRMNRLTGWAAKLAGNAYPI
jgi:hypothetical protein